MSHEYPTRPERERHDRGGDVFRRMQTLVREGSTPRAEFEALSKTDRAAFLWFATSYWNADHAVRNYAPGYTLVLVDRATLPSGGT